MARSIQQHRQDRTGAKPPAAPADPVKGPEEKSPATGRPLPACPKYLGTHGNAAYAHCVSVLKEMKLEDAADMRAVEAFAGAYEDYREARELVDEEGRTYQTFTQSGELKIQKHPGVDIMNDAWKRMASLLPHLCFTPVSRSKGKGKSNKKDDVDPFAAFLPGGN